MAELDAKQVVNTVQSGMIPDTWRVFRASRSSFLFDGVMQGFFAFIFLVMSACTLYILFLPDMLAADSETRILLTLTFCLALGIGVGLVRAVFRSVAQSRLAQEHWIALTPDGVVEYRGDKGRVQHFERFAGVSSITFTIRYHHTGKNIALAFNRAGRSSTSTFWLDTLEIDPRFPYGEQIAQAIIVAHTRYVANHTQTY